jgi:disulfide bond formation protein DsbB
MTRNRLLLIATLGSALLLAGAWTFQFLGYAPCKLCHWQRWPHYTAVGIGALALLTRLRFLPWFGALAAAATAVLGVYHTGVEQKWWLGPTTCTSGSVAGLSADDLLAQINNAPLIRCDEVAWALAGISMASWNAILSAILFLFWIAAARRA